MIHLSLFTIYYFQELFLRDNDFELKLLNICGYYWHQLVKVPIKNIPQPIHHLLLLTKKVTKALRNEGDSSGQLSEILGLPVEDVLMVHVADGQTVEHHSPGKFF